MVRRRHKQNKKAQHAKTKLFLSCASKRAQLQQMFIYVSAILVIGFIVIFGYRMIGKVLDQKCVVEEQSFMGTIDEFTEGNIRAGARDEAIIPTTCHYDMICFVNATAIGVDDWEAPVGLSSDGVDYSKINTDIIEANTQDGIYYNIYLYKSGSRHETLPVAYDERINVANSEGIICVRAIVGSFRFMIEGRGKHGVLVSSSS